MRDVELHIYDVQNGQVKNCGEFSISKLPEGFVASYYRKKGYNVVNIEPGKTDFPDEVSWLEEIIEPGAPDLFAYAEDKENRFVEVKTTGGLRFKQIQYMTGTEIHCEAAFLIDDKEHECSDCGKIFDSENGLKIHKASCYSEPDEAPVQVNRFSRFRGTGSSRGGSE